MKKLKLDHQVADLVRQGNLRSTWRLFDDKDLTVNDEVELIDKVKPNQPQTWQVLGAARVKRVVQKRLGEISDDDFQAGALPGQPDTPEDRLEVCRRYYGENVTLQTPVKMIDFEMLPQAQRNAGDNRHVIVYADGGSRGNPGPSACGYIVMTDDEQVLVDKGEYLGITTNNQAEYQGLKHGLEEALAMGAREVSVRLDSLLVINQMKGIFKVKNRDLWPIHDAIKNLVKSFDKVSFTHVPRELNKLADAAVNRTLDEATGRPKGS